MDSGKLFSFGLIALVLLACPFSAPPQENGAEPPAGEAGTQPLPEPSENSAMPPPPPEGNGKTDEQVEAQWARITNGNVEQSCLAEAKREAVASGYSDSLVFSCSCTADEGSGVKSYDCSVSAADGAHPGSVICTKSQQACQISSEQGTYAYTFDEIIQMWG